MTDIENPKAQQDEAIQGAPSWEGHFLACCGDPCTPRGWGICCLTLWLPCITHGLNLKYLYAEQKVVLGVLLFVALCYVLPCIVFPAVFLTAFKAPDIIACEVDLINAQPTSGPLDPDFTQKLIICQKPGWTKVWIVIAFMWACSISLLIYLTIIRMKMRQRLAIPAPQQLHAVPARLLHHVVVRQLRPVPGESHPAQEKHSQSPLSPDADDTTRAPQDGSVT